MKLAFRRYATSAEFRPNAGHLPKAQHLFGNAFIKSCFISYSIYAATKYCNSIQLRLLKIFLFYKIQKEEVLNALDKNSFESILKQIDDALPDRMPNLNRSKTELNHHLTNLRSTYKTTI